MRIRFIITLLLFTALLLFITPIKSLADADITIDAKAGFQNKVKYSRGVPIQITASNNGAAFSGDLVLDYSESHNIGAGLTVPLDLAAGESKTFQLSLPGLIDNQYSGIATNQTIFLYEDGWKKGRSVDFKGSKTLKPNYFNPEVLFVATLTENADRLGGIENLLPVAESSVQIFHFSDQGDVPLPSDALAWDSLDYLIIDEFPYSDLPAETQQAILSWLEQGGKIIIGANNKLAAATGNLSELLPMELSSPVEMSIPGFANPLTVYQADIKEGAEVIREEQGSAIIAERTIGAGMIIQTAFSLGDKPVVSQQGYKDFLLPLFEVGQAAGVLPQDLSIKERISYEIGMANELFESFAVSKPTMFFIILLYIIIAVPVLYIVLMKKDKREYAWMAIPIIAIVTSLGIFAAGAKDRIANPQIQQTGFYEVDSDGGLNGYYMNTVLSNRSGDYQFTAPSTTTMTAISRSQFSESHAHNDAILENHTGASVLTMRDMRYWSVASIIGESYIGESGKFEIQLSINEGSLIGTIRNTFPFSVHDAAVWTGTRLLPLGNFKSGEEKQVAENVQSDILHSISPIVHNLSPQMMGSKEELIEARKQSTLAMSYEHLEGKASTPYLIAYTDAAITPVTLEGQDAKVSAVHLLAQSFEPDVEFEGQINITSENLLIDIKPENSQGYIEEYPENPYFYGLEPGEYLIQYELPKVLANEDIDWSRLEVLTAVSDVEFSILRNDTMDFEPLSVGTAEMIENSNIYISEEGIIEIRITKSGPGGYSEVTIPKIELEGVVNQ